MKYWRGYLVAAIMAAITWALTQFAQTHSVLIDMVYPYMTRLVVTSMADWTGGIAEGSVVLTGINQDVAAKDTVATITAKIAELKAGTLNVFDTANFTVGGEKLASYKADVDTDAAYEKDTEVIENGVFYESKHRSAPYFDLRIDGITLLNEKY